MNAQTENLRVLSKVRDPLIPFIEREFISICEFITIFNIFLQPFSVFGGHIISCYYFPLSTHFFFKPGKMNKGETQQKPFLLKEITDGVPFNELLLHPN